MYLALFVLLFLTRAASLDLVCGLYHNCVFERGTTAMKCWGQNGNGQLGYNDTNHRGGNPNEMSSHLTFVHIGTGFVVEDMQLGWQHSCAKSVDRAMKCFGSNAVWELGTVQLAFVGVTTTGDALPFLLFGADFNLSKIAAGDSHTCALSTDAALKCFGYNVWGQCGAGTSTTSISGPPSQINAIDLGTNFTAVDVQTFHWHVCVKSQQGTAKCFGWNNAGQLGYGDTTNRGATPESMGDGLLIVNLGSNFTVAAIATGDYHSCALSTTKTVKCWGDNNYGQCGTPYSTETGDNLLVLEFGVDFVPMQLALGGYYTCILSESAVLICFGRNDLGQLGIGSTTDVGTPSTLTGIDLGTDFVPRQVAAGWAHTCAVSTGDAIKCWGYNAFGQLGLGHTNHMGDGPNEMGDNLPFVDVAWPSAAPTTASPTNEPTTEPTTVPTGWVIGAAVLCLILAASVYVWRVYIRKTPSANNKRYSAIDAQTEVEHHDQPAQISMTAPAVDNNQSKSSQPKTESENAGADVDNSIMSPLLSEAQGPEVQVASGQETQVERDETTVAIAQTS